ncbi:hypothetical protein REPUB_Repub17cG0047900 [Reevesia pubescens]
MVFDKIYSNKDMVKKILNSLPKSWEAKVTAIEESKDLNTLSLDELIGFFITYEMKVKHRERNQNKNSFKEYDVAFNSRKEVNKDKDMAIFASRFDKFKNISKEMKQKKKKKKTIVGILSDCDESNHYKKNVG